MEVIKINKDELQLRFANMELLKDIITNLENTYAATNQVICSVKVNGLALSEADETRFANTNKSDIHEIEIQIEDKFKLLQESLASTCSYAQELKKQVLTTSELFRFTPNIDAHRSFTDMMSAVQCLSNALIVIKCNVIATAVKLNLDMLKWAAAEKQMMDTVQELIEAYEAQDYIRVSDILEYELSTTMDLWDEVLQANG